ncbi:hypothetical protein PsorP6_002247 [Peronosclerospora sorghi]|uniref:Uncharacterized protein n=1 Tax=Peronosclerospora sorghi TaxID=230839 RepID=A0ACC0WT89_9STRA|nr:hypothetical protein PsorP6_002247 [Peronosclerospora sorghi]
MYSHKKMSIPEHVPIGAALREKHGVRCFVDGKVRKVALSGSRKSIESAENELAELFASLAIKKDRVFEVAVHDGPNRSWSFKRDEDISNDAQVEEYPYRLQQSGPALESGSEKESWITEFCEHDTANVMAYLRNTPSDLPLSIKVAFGKLCFKLKSIRCANSTIAWPELQKLRHFDDFSTRWSNHLRRSFLPIVTLMDDLEEWMEKGVVLQKTLSVHVVDAEKMQFDLKYHFEDGQWKLRKSHNRRHVHGTYDVILNNEVSFRVRAISRDRCSKNALLDIERHLDITIPDNDDIFSTKVSVNPSASNGMYIKGFLTKSKLHVDVNDLRFTISYLDQKQEEFRLQCRLTTTQKEKLDVNDNEAQVLVDKTLQILS